MSEPLQSVTRATNILRVLSESGTGGAGVTEIANKVRLAKSTTHRILATLCRADMARLDPRAHRYTLGPGVLQLAAGWLNETDMRAVAVPPLRRLCTETRAAVTLSVRGGDHRVPLERLDGSHEVRSAAVDAGRLLPLHLDASGRAILAFLPEPQAKRILRSAGLTAGRVRPLLGELKKIRRTGTAESRGEDIPGTVAISAPLFNHKRVVGSVSILGLKPRAQAKDLERFRVLLLAATGKISRELARSD